MSKSFSVKEVAEHNTQDKGLYIIIDGGVYELGGGRIACLPKRTRTAILMRYLRAGFVDEHPGGAKILKRVGGKDASKQFWKVC